MHLPTASHTALSTEPSYQTALPSAVICSGAASAHRSLTSSCLYKYETGYKPTINAHSVPSLDGGCLHAWLSLFIHHTPGTPVDSAAASVAASHKHFLLFAECPSLVRTRIKVDERCDYFKRRVRAPRHLPPTCTAIACPDDACSQRIAAIIHRTIELAAIDGTDISTAVISSKDTE